MEIRQIAIDFIKSLSVDERERIKSMLAHGVICGADYARSHEIEPVLFSEELKLIFMGK